MKNYIKNIAYGLGFLMFAASCDNFLDVRPKGEVLGKDLLTERKGFENALYGAYASMRNDKAYGKYMTYYVMDVLAQYFNCPGNTDLTDLSTFKYKENAEVRKLFYDLWLQMYKNISYVNNVLINLENQSPETLQFYDIYKGEALGLRAYMHFDLLRLFCEQATDADTRGIVYNTEFSLTPSEVLPKKEVLERIIADLREAERLLDNPELYAAAAPTDGFFLDQSIHFNVQAARGTLARVYLTCGELDSAYHYAHKVIEESGLELADKTEIKDDVIGKLSTKETIFGLYSKDQFYTATKSDLYDAVSFSSLDPWSGIEGVYANGAGGNDYRWAAWFETRNSKLRCIKLTDPYQLTSGTYPADRIPGVNLLRLPEMYYIVAECLLRKGDPAAADYFDAVLESRGLPALGDRTPAEQLTLEKITEERYKEFVGEGQTFFNMKRLNLDIQTISGEVLPASKDIYVVEIPEEEFNYRH